MLMTQMRHELSALLPRSFDMAGTAVFATSGALAAASGPDRSWFEQGGSIDPPAVIVTARPSVAFAPV
jgi:hypothetical protein